MRFKKGTIPNEIPGYRIKSVGQYVEIDIKQATLKATAVEANKIAGILDQVANDPYWWGLSQLRTKRTYGSSYGSDGITLETGDGMLVRRRGRGLVIEINKYDKRRNSARQSLSPDIASDLVILIRAAAAKVMRR